MLNCFSLYFVSSFVAVIYFDFELLKSFSVVQSPNLSCVFDSDDESALLYNMQFWQEVCDYELYKDRTTDRRVSVSRAWDIFNKYIASDAAFSIGKSIPPFNASNSTQLEL